MDMGLDQNPGNNNVQVNGSALPCDSEKAIDSPSTLLLQNPSIRQLIHFYVNDLNAHLHLIVFFGSAKWIDNKYMQTYMHEYWHVYAWLGENELKTLL